MQTVLPLLLSLLSAPDFHDAWYRETVDGDLERAYHEYAQIYRAASDEVPVELRRRAALRAGLCAEKLGNVQRAVDAYEWFHVMGAPGDRWTQQAATRMRVLATRHEGIELGGEADAALVPVRVLPGDEGERLRERIARRLERRRRAAELLRSTRDREDARVARRARIEARLLALGIEIHWPIGAFVNAGPSRAGLVEWLDRLDLVAGDRRLLVDRLVDRLFVEGLKALRARRYASAWGFFGLQRQLGNTLGEDHSELLLASEYQRTILGILEAASGLEESASEVLGERFARRESRERAVLGKRVEELEARVEAGEAQAALELADAAIVRSEWLPWSRVKSATVRELALRARSLRALLLPNWESLEEPLAAAAAGEVGVLVDGLFLREGFLREIVEPPETLRPRLEDRASMLPRLARERDRTLDLLEASAPSDASDASDRETRRGLVDDTLVLLEWFPELDESGQVARRLARLRP